MHVIWDFGNPTNPAPPHTQTILKPVVVGHMLIPNPLNQAIPQHFLASLKLLIISSWLKAIHHLFGDS